MKGVFQVGAVHDFQTINILRMLEYLFLKSIVKNSDVVLVERSKYDMLFTYFLDMPSELIVLEY